MIVHIKFHRFENSERKQLKPFSMRDTQTAFYCLGIGLLLCLIMFFVELFGKMNWQKYDRVFRFQIQLRRTINIRFYRKVFGTQIPNGTRQKLRKRKKRTKRHIQYIN